MSSERNGPGNEVGADDAAQQDSWFEPARRADGAPAGNGHAGEFGSADAEWARGDADDGQQAADWFLRTGRAGLPDSVAVSWEDGETTAEWRHKAAGAPPWAADAVQSDGEPPPWESGPWPEPSEVRTHPAGPVAGDPASADVRAGAQAREPRPEEADNWQARAALATGFLPLLVPGIVLGVLGLRRSRSVGTGQTASWVGIAVSVVWAVVLGFLIFGTGGSPSSNCSVPSAVNASYARVMNDFSGGATTSVLSTDASAAASQANAAAAYTGHLPLRNALFALARDLEQVQSDLTSGKKAASVPATLRHQLSADGAALTTACGS